MPKISVLMPCLNVAEYIQQCLESVVVQTFEDIEILVIDAGSTDGTLEIIEQFAARDNRIQLLHSTRKSYGYQLNLALCQAKGEYIGIVETDDYIEPDMFEALYEAIAGTEAEYAKAGWIGFLHRNNVKWTYEGWPCPEVRIAEEAILIPWKRPDLLMTDCYLWSGIYRKDFLRRYPFQESAGAAFQDVGVLFQLIHGARQGIYLKRSVYHYRNDNAAASFYNRNGLNYVRAEYQALESLLPEMSEGWRRMYYWQLAGHVLGRFDAMAVSRKTFGEESADSILWLQGRLQDAVQKGILQAADFDGEQWQKLQDFLQGAEILSQNWQKKLTPLWDFLAKAYRQEIVIFGCAAMGQFIAKALRMGNFEVCAFCDNDAQKQGDILNKVPVLSIEDAAACHPGACFVLASRRNMDEMAAQLKAVGVSEQNVWAGWKTYISEKHTLWAVLQFAAQYKRGEKDD